MGVSVAGRPSFRSYLDEHLSTVEALVSSDEPLLTNRERFNKACFVVWCDYEARFGVDLDAVGIDSSEPFEGQ